MSVFLQSFFRSQCVHCHLNPIQSSIKLCNDCLLNQHWYFRRCYHSDLLSGTWVLGGYSSALGSLIRRGKYRPDRHIFQELGREMAEASLDLPLFDAIVHVPVPWHRRIKRGFDQSEILASQMAKMLDVPRYNALRRHGFIEQASRTKEERLQRILGRFSMRDIELPETILLVDDTITTGATLEACASELLQSGVKEVFAVAVSSIQINP